MYIRPTNDFKIRWILQEEQLNNMLKTTYLTGGWMIFILFRLVTQHYCQACLIKLKKLFEGMLFVIATSTFISSILRHYQLTKYSIVIKLT